MLLICHHKTKTEEQFHGTIKLEMKTIKQNLGYSKKGKEYITIEKDNNNKGYFHLQKDEEKRLSLNALQTKLTYQQLIEFGYKLQKTKIEFKN